MGTNNIHGKNAVVYLGAGGAAAINISEQSDWSIDMDNATVDVSSLNQTWKNFVKGMIGWTGTIGGNFNTAQTQLWLASIGNNAENFYLYPTSAVPGSYYYGQAWVTLNKIAAGSTTTKAASSFKLTGNGALSTNP